VTEESKKQVQLISIFPSIEIFTEHLQQSTVLADLSSTAATMTR